jgi:hypothetical protein
VCDAVVVVSENIEGHVHRVDDSEEAESVRWAGLVECDVRRTSKPQPTKDQ